jgi:hypothetical protein
LLHQLASLTKDHKISFWYDDPIDQKKEWSPQIVSRFEEADVHLILLNNSLLHSKFIEQVEFKWIIDKYKSGESQVIPIVLEKCPWDIDFESKDYSFNFKELNVLPKARKPLKSWNPIEKAVENCAVSINNQLLKIRKQRDIVPAIKSFKLNEERIGVQLVSNVKKRKNLLSGAAAAALLVFGIMFFSGNSAETKQVAPIQTENDITAVNVSNIEDETNNQIPEITTLSAAATISKPMLGDELNGGVIFEINDISKIGIIASMKDVGPMIWSDAIKIHEQLGEGWRLPTLDELKLMYTTIGQGNENRGQFEDALYWSATPYDDYQARLVRFSDGSTKYHYNSVGTHRKFLVRAVRDFSQD